MIGVRSLIRCNPATYSLKLAEHAVSQLLGLSIYTEDKLLSVVFHHLRRHFLHLRVVFIVIALGVWGGCRAKTDDKARSMAPDLAQHIRVDSSAEPMRPLARLYALYLPGVSIIADTTRTVGTDAQGRGVRRDHVAPGECLDVLIDASHDEMHDFFVGVFYAPSAHDHDDSAKAHDAWAPKQLLSYDYAHSTAWSLSHVCPQNPGPIYFVLQGRPEERYQIQVHRRPADAVDQALFEQARRDLIGFRGYGPLQTEVLAHDRRRSYPLAISRDHCLAIAAHADAGLQDLDAQLLGLDGEVLALEVATDASSIVGPYCPLEDEIIRVEFRAYEGQGGFRWQRWEAPKSIGQRLVDARMASKDGTLNPRFVEDVWRRTLRPLRSLGREGF